MTALQKTKVIDVTDAQSIYGAKLLADLGADTIRPELIGGDPLRKRGPFDQETGTSLWYLYFTTNRRHFRFDPENEEQASQLVDLCSNADILLYSPDSPVAKHLNVDALKKTNSRLVVIECSSFGTDGPWKDFKAPDLVAGALGGSAALTGDADTPPLKLWGDLNFMVPGSYVAVAALAGLYHMRATEEGQSVQVPVHECIASCLEHAFMWYFCHEYFPQSHARTLPRRGSLHWTDMYHVMTAKNGSVMVTPAPSVDAQLAWMIEEDAFEDLLDPEYQVLGNHRRYVVRMMELLRKWVATKDANELFEQAQERHLPYGIVNRVDSVAGNPQLAARDWWKSYSVGDRTIRGVGAPYQFSKTPVEIKGTPSGTDQSVVDLVGWGESS